MSGSVAPFAFRTDHGLSKRLVISPKTSKLACHLSLLKVKRARGMSGGWRPKASICSKQGDGADDLHHRAHRVSSG